MISDRLIRRAAALEAAATVAAAQAAPARPGHPTVDPRLTARHVLQLADLFDAWLNRPAPAVTARIIAGTPVDRNQPEGTPVSLVMPDNDQVTLTAAALDAEGVAVADTFTDPAGPYLAPFTWTVDNTALGELTPAADTLSVVLKSAPGQVGTVTVTATDANGKAMVPFTVEIDPSAAVSAGIVASTPVPRDTTA